MIRPARPDDTFRLLELTAGTGVFKPHEVETLREVLDDYYAEAQGQGHRCVADERDGRVVGYAYYAPAEMTDHTWQLWWIAVDRGDQGRGLGRGLLRHAEDDARGHGGRLMLIETSSLPAYAPTHRFYLANGYGREAEVRDFYADGDGQVIFRKRLRGSETGGG
jgi:ribosomal protein S18 acetylase RimI-like enzyme